MTAANVIRDEIERHGSIPFSRFMEIALYNPQLGYYRRDRFGKRGDFYTAEQFPVFGGLLRAFTGDAPVLELGAGRRELARFFPSYKGIDIDDPKTPGSFEGVVIANEFFDALPVRLLRGHRELMVYSDPEFRFCEVPGTAELAAYAERYPGVREFNTELEIWVRRVGAMLTRGKFLIIDYGYDAAELARFPEGTLMSYSAHQATADVLRNPGEQDITAHVNFDELRRCALDSGFEIDFDGTLRDWALRIPFSPSGMREMLEWKQVVVGMGEIFRVLLLQKRLYK